MFMSFKKYVVSLLLTLSMLFSLSGHAKSPVFKVSKGDDYVYIGGTIHLLSPSDYPLPIGFDKAFNNAQKIFFEVNSDDFNTLETQTKSAKVMMFQDERTLKSELNEDTYNRLSKFLEERQLPIAVFSKFTPAGVSITLTIFELQRLGLGNPESGVDHFFQLKTRQSDSKSDSYLETIDEQIRFLDSFNQVDANTLIQSSLEDLDVLQVNWKNVLTAWRNGEMLKMSNLLGADQMKAQFPLIYKTLLIDRNERWLKQITPMFETPEVELILVGALHLVGEGGLIELLQAQGYAVEQLD